MELHFYEIVITLCNYFHIADLATQTYLVISRIDITVKQPGLFVV